MNPIKTRFYIERYNKENRDIKLYEEFIPKPNAKPLTGKFYARHEILRMTDFPEEYVQLIEKHVSSTPKDIYAYHPPSVNMEYGWFSTPLIERSTDERLWFPRKSPNFIKNELKIRHLHRGIPVEKFVGVPFRV